MGTGKEGAEGGESCRDTDVMRRSQVRLPSTLKAPAARVMVYRRLVVCSSACVCVSFLWDHDGRDAVILSEIRNGYSVNMHL